MKRLYSPALLAVLSLFLVNVSSESALAKAAAPGYPFHGKLQAVDASAETITVAGKTPRVFHLTAETKVTDGAGNATTLATAVVGEDVGGYVLKEPALTLKSLRLGAKAGTKTASTTETPAAAAATATPAAPAPAPTPTAPSAAAPDKATAEPAAAPATETAAAPTKAKKLTFSGKVVSVSGDTVVVHGKVDKTFTAASGTKFTGATALSDLKAGEKVSGTYTTGADGTMTLATLKTK